MTSRIHIAAISRQRAGRAVVAILAVATALALGITGCSSGSAPASTSSSSSQAPILKGLSGSAKARIASLISTARSEGALNWIDASIIVSEKPLVAEFKKEYGLPGLKVTFQNVLTSQITSRVDDEVKANKITTDIVGLDGVPEFFTSLKQAGALLKYSSPNLAPYRASAKYVSDDFGYWVSADAVIFLPVYNPKVFPNGITSWYDLLNPKLNGKVCLFNPATSESSLYTYYGLRQVLPLSYFQDLAKNGARLENGSAVQKTADVADGQYDVCVTSSFRTGQTNAKLGVHTAVGFPKQGSVMLGLSWGILAHSPDPAAAELFMDFLLSKSGQQIIVDKEGLTSLLPGITMPKAQQKYSPASLAAAHAIPVNWSAGQATLNKYLSEWNSLSFK